MIYTKIDKFIYKKIRKYILIYSNICDKDKKKRVSEEF